jgi:Ca2+-binding EF-hand superfamily protein
MQVPGRYDPETRRCVVDKPELVAETGHWIDADGDDTVSKAEFARWFWRRQGRSPNDAEWSAFQRADVDRNGTIDVKEFEAFLREKFGPKAVPRDEEQVKSLEDSLDEFSEVSELVASSFGWHARTIHAHSAAGGVF